MPDLRPLPRRSAKVHCQVVAFSNMSKLRESAEVSYAVRLRVIVKYVGQLCLISTFLTIVPATFAIISGDFQTLTAYVGVALIFATFGFVGHRTNAPERIQHNEAYVIAACVFPLSAIVLTGPFMTSGLPFDDALFESVSGITTTGLSTLPSVENVSQTFLFARCWLQWYGGLGIVVLSLALATHPGVVAARMGSVESSDEDLIGSTRAHARRVLFIYGSITLIACVVLWALGLTWFHAVTHSFAAVSTGGFSSYDASLAAFPSFWPQFAVTMICLACSVSLPFYWRLGQDGWRALARELQLWALLGMATVASLLLVVFMVNADSSLFATARNAVLMALSAQTTAGFSTTSVAELDPASKLVLIVSMAVGGGAGSTAGGFKILRLLIFLRVLQTLLLRTALPKHAVHEPHLQGRRLQDSTVQPALLIIVLFGVVVLLSWLPFLAYGFDPLGSLFEVVSATGTVGLSAGISSQSLPPLLKAVLCLDMLFGRLEFIALLVLFSPRTWFGKRVATR